MRTSLFKKLTATVLAALMLLPVAACADTSETPEDTAATAPETLPNATVGTTAESEADTTDQNYVCDLPDDLDYKGTTVTIMYVKVAAREDELVSHDELGHGTISDSVFERNLQLETQLGVKLAFVDEASDTAAQNKIRTMVKAKDDSIDLFVLGTYCAMDPAIEGNYLNLNNIEPVNLDKHYWSQDYNAMMTLTSDKKQFLATSPAALSLFRLTYLTIFNRDLFADRGIPDLYEAVNNGEWTLDYQLRLISDVWDDTDGDGRASEDDFYGLITGNCISVDAYCVASDIHMVVQDEYGTMIFNVEDGDRIIDMGEKVSAIYNTQGTYYFRDQTYDDIGKHYINEKFAAEEGLMATTQFLGIEHNIEALTAFNYGIVPMPKLNEEQENYMTYVQDQVSAFGISGAVSNEDRIYMLGALMEAMAYHSNEIVRPAYYDSALSLRFMQDPDSRAILDTMFETISFDYCYATGFGDIRGELRTGLSAKDPAMASRVSKWERSLDRRLEKLNSSLDNLN